VAWPGPPDPAKLARASAKWAYLGPLLLVALTAFSLPTALFDWLPPVIIRSRNRHVPFVRHHTAQSLNLILTGWLVLLGLIVLAVAVAAGGLFDADSPPVVKVVASTAVAVAVLAALVRGVAAFVYEIIGISWAASGEWGRIPGWVALPLIRDAEYER
jgi:uncharacterized Tic20 family protein